MDRYVIKQIKENVNGLGWTCRMCSLYNFFACLNLLIIKCLENIIAIELTYMGKVHIQYTQ